jgi:hypothetical protein
LKEIRPFGYVHFDSFLNQAREQGKHEKTLRADFFASDRRVSDTDFISGMIQKWI